MSDFSTYFDIYFFDDIALATLETVIVGSAEVSVSATATVSGDVDIGIELSAQAASATLSASAEAAMATIATVSPQAVTITGGADTQLSLALQSAAGIAVSADVVTAPAIVGEGDLSLAGNAVGIVAKMVDVPAQAATVTGAAALQLDMFATAGSISIISDANVQIEFAAASGNATICAGDISPLTFARDAALVRYYFTLTGSADGTTNVIIPISTIQGRIRQSTPTYLQVTIPSLDFINYITNRSNGEMKIDMVYVDTSGNEYGRREIASAELEDIRYDQGGQSQTITLIGHKTTTHANPRTVTISNIIYKSYQNGAVRVRAPLNLAVFPGDTAVAGVESFVIDNITYTVGVGQAQMEISEAAA